ncbi:MAG: hypothetical protein MAG431_00272 [Chloroflexi bacterium]|nr:hypothetical protein [Chloroflexota bacterium]
MSTFDRSTCKTRRQLYPRPGIGQRIMSLFWRGSLPEAFWTIAGVFSLALNVILIAALIIIGRELFALKSVVNDHLLGGLATNFEKMDEAKIATTIGVEDEIQVKFDLPVQTNKQVILTDSVALRAPVKINTGPISINAMADIELPKGLLLPIALDIMVPVETMVPINLEVPVDIPLKETELHEPFVGLQDVVKPYQDLLTPLPNSWQEVELCQTIPGCERLLAPETSLPLLDNLRPSE